MNQKNWIRLVVMVIASFAAMYLLMYVMVDRLSNVYPNVNQFYMASVMTAAMVIIEMMVMGAMYQNKLARFIIAGTAVLALVSFFAFTRAQTAVSDEQFLKSMIPHHGAAILMCKEAQISDPEIGELCQAILRNQQAEIDFMKQKLQSLQ